jgi:hypothetical protein
VHSVLGRHQRALADLAGAKEALDGARVSHLVVKGPAVARWYAEPSLRSSVDLDLLVRPAEVGPALEALEDAGFFLLDGNWPLLRHADVHELVLGTPSGGALDLHWSLGPSPMTIDHSPDADLLLARSVGFDAGGVGVRGLGDADAVVHLAVHAAASGGHRLVWLADLRAALEATVPDIDELRSRAEEWGALPAVTLMLGRLRRTLGDGRAVPGRLTWATAAWHGLDELIMQLSPPELTGTGGSLARIVARSARSSTTGSIAALGGKVLSRVSQLGTGPDLARVHDPRFPGSARHLVGGAAGRSEFLSWMQARGR